MSRNPPPIPSTATTSLVLDFDGTITLSDTTALLGLHAATRALRSRTLSFPPPPCSPESLWTCISQAYFLSLTKHQKEYEPPAVERHTLAQELEALESLRAIEEACIQRVREEGLFEELEVEELESLGRDVAKDGRVQRRRGFRELVKWAKGWGWKMGIVSVNWSRAFAKGVLAADGEDWDVRANELAGATDSNKKALLITAHDKFTALKEMVGSMESCVYIGDSTTDLECLVKASRGIVIVDGETNGVLDTLKRLGFEVRHVAKCEGEWRLVWARDFEEVLANGFFKGGGPDGVKWGSA